MKLLHGTVLAGAVAGVVAVVFVACSDTPVPTAPVPSSTPTPVTVVAPTPTPVPSPTLVPTTSCDQMPDCAADCCHEGEEGQYDNELRAAMAAVAKENPRFLDENGILTITAAEYTNAVATKVTQLYGLCARGGDKPGPPVGHSISEDEVAIKRDNRSSQNTDIIYANGSPALVRYYNCRPASF